VICPKCQDLLRTLERNGVHIEQCERCGGIFLDRGELEQIVAAERNHYAQAEPVHQPTAALQPPTAPYPVPTGQQPPVQQPPVQQPPAQQPPVQPGYAPPPVQPGYAPPPAQPGYAPPPAQGPPPPYQPAPGPPQPAYGGHGQPHGYPHRRRSFLEELFD
jgi:Zn-finger nucleic acid-binding protein